MPKLSEQTIQALSELAFSAQSKSYSPYSKFKVGAALISDDQQTYSGCNVENASYPLGQCAESSAISAMINGGGARIQEILIASPNDDFCPPCGGCRQKIREFADENTLVHLVSKQGKIKTLSISELLPLAFIQSSLNK